MNKAAIKMYEFPLSNPSPAPNGGRWCISWTEKSRESVRKAIEAAIFPRRLEELEAEMEVVGYTREIYYPEYNNDGRLVSYYAKKADKCSDE